MNLLYTLALTSVYIFNSLGQYLSVGEDGKPVLSKEPVEMDVTPANETPLKDANRWNFKGKDIKWILKPSANGYTLGYQDSDAYSTAFVYTLDGAIATSYEEPGASFASGQWFYSTEAPKQQVVYLDETKKYVQPTFTGDYVDVELKRKLYAKEWNSICLPFSVSADQVVAAWGAGTKVLEFTSTTGNNLNLTERAYIKAGTPYFIQPARVNANHTYTFTDIETATWDCSGKVPSVTIEPIKLTGFYSPSELPARCYVFGDENKLYHLTDAMQANGFRCYFQDMNGSNRQLTWGIDDNTTGIDGTFVTPQAPKVGNIYTVNGQLVRRNSTAAGLAPGVYIMNGIKLIVK